MDLVRYEVFKTMAIEKQFSYLYHLQYRARRYVRGFYEKYNALGAEEKYIEYVYNSLYTKLNSYGEIFSSFVNKFDYKVLQLFQKYPAKSYTEWESEQEQSVGFGTAFEKEISSVRTILNEIVFGMFWGMASLCCELYSAVVFQEGVKDGRDATAFNAFIGYKEMGPVSVEVPLMLQLFQKFFSSNSELEMYVKGDFTLNAEENAQIQELNAQDAVRYNFISYFLANAEDMVTETAGVDTPVEVEVEDERRGKPEEEGEGAGGQSESEDASTVLSDFLSDIIKQGYSYWWDLYFNRCHVYNRSRSEEKEKDAFSIYKKFLVTLSTVLGQQFKDALIDSKDVQGIVLTGKLDEQEAETRIVDFINGLYLTICLYALSTIPFIYIGGAVCVVRMFGVQVNKVLYEKVEENYSIIEQDRKLVEQMNDDSKSTLTEISGVLRKKFYTDAKNASTVQDIVGQWESAFDYIRGLA